MPIPMSRKQKYGVKVLLYCPLNPATPRVYARTVQSIFTLDWPWPIDIVFGRQDAIKEGQNGYDNLTEKHNHARQMVLDCDYDALFLVEADMILPEDALKRLAAIDTDVAYGLYCSRHGSRQWLAFDKIEKHTGKSIDRNRKYCVDNWGRVVDTKGVGMGCTFIWQRVLHKLTFRRDGPCADDWYFSLDCIEQGFRQRHDLGVVCGHILNQGTNSILWPAINQPDFMYEIERPEQT